jgi:AcrR family transcriptional regulator
MNGIINDFSQSRIFSMNPAPTSRVERRKQETRTRIIAAAESLMLVRSIDVIKISEITEAADVGHGSFYLHFKSKYDILVPIISARARRWDALLQDAVKDFDDPAEVMAFSGRHMGRIIHADRHWRWFLEHSGVPATVLHELLGGFSGRDFTLGLQSGRFRVSDQKVSALFLFGGFVNALLNSFNSENPEHIIDHTMEMMLLAVELESSEAKRIAHGALAPLSLPYAKLTNPDRGDLST